jgi:hypothetical protein
MYFSIYNLNPQSRSEIGAVAGYESEINAKDGSEKIILDPQHCLKHHITHTKVSVF